MSRPVIRCTAGGNRPAREQWTYHVMWQVDDEVRFEVISVPYGNFSTEVILNVLGFPHNPD